MTMTLKFDEGNTIIKHVEFSEGIILGIATRNETRNLVEQESLYLVNGFIFAYDDDAFYSERKTHAVEDNDPKNMEMFDHACTLIGQYVDRGLYNIPEIRIQRKLGSLGAGSDTQKYIKTLINSTKK